MATTPAVLSLEEYLQTTYKPDCDFVDDHIEERNVGLFDHGRTQALVGSWFLSQEDVWRTITFLGNGCGSHRAVCGFRMFASFALTRHESR